MSLDMNANLNADLSKQEEIKVAKSLAPPSPSAEPAVPKITEIPLPERAALVEEVAKYIEKSCATPEPTQSFDELIPRMQIWKTRFQECFSRKKVRLASEEERKRSEDFTPLLSVPTPKLTPKQLTQVKKYEEADFLRPNYVKGMPTWKIVAASVGTLGIAPLIWGIGLLINSYIRPKAVFKEYVQEASSQITSYEIRKYSLITTAGSKSTDRDNIMAQAKDITILGFRRLDDAIQHLHTYKQSGRIEDRVKAINSLSEAIKDLEYLDKLQAISEKASMDHLKACFEPLQQAIKEANNLYKFTSPASREVFEQILIKARPDFKDLKQILEIQVLLSDSIESSRSLIERLDDLKSKEKQQSAEQLRDNYKRMSDLRKELVVQLNKLPSINTKLRELYLDVINNEIDPLLTKIMNKGVVWREVHDNSKKIVGNSTVLINRIKKEPTLNNEAKAKLRTQLELLMKTYKNLQEVYAQYRALKIYGDEVADEGLHTATLKDVGESMRESLLLLNNPGQMPTIKTEDSRDELRNRLHADLIAKHGQIIDKFSLRTAHLLYQKIAAPLAGPIVADAETALAQDISDLMLIDSINARYELAQIDEELVQLSERAVPLPENASLQERFPLLYRFAPTTTPFYDDIEDEEALIAPDQGLLSDARRYEEDFHPEETDAEEIAENQRLLAEAVRKGLPPLQNIGPEFTKTEELCQLFNRLYNFAESVSYLNKVEVMNTSYALLTQSPYLSNQAALALREVFSEVLKEIQEKVGDASLTMTSALEKLQLQMKMMKSLVIKQEGLFEGHGTVLRQEGLEQVKKAVPSMLALISATRKQIDTLIKALGTPKEPPKEVTSLEVISEEYLEIDELRKQLNQLLNIDVRGLQDDYQKKELRKQLACLINNLPTEKLLKLIPKEYRALRHRIDLWMGFATKDIDLPGDKDEELIIKYRKIFIGDPNSEQSKKLIERLEDRIEVGFIEVNAGAYIPLAMERSIFTKETLAAHIQLRTERDLPLTTEESSVISAQIQKPTKTAVELTEERKKHKKDYPSEIKEINIWRERARHMRPDVADAIDATLKSRDDARVKAAETLKTQFEDKFKQWEQGGKPGLMKELESIAEKLEELEQVHSAWKGLASEASIDKIKGIFKETQDKMRPLTEILSPKMEASPKSKSESVSSASKAEDMSVSDSIDEDKFKGYKEEESKKADDSDDDLPFLR